MEKKNISQKYTNIVDCFIIISNINGMNINDFMYGFKLYINAKRMHFEETASVLADHLIDTDIDGIPDMDCACEIIDMKEYIESLEQQSSHQL